MPIQPAHKRMDDPAELLLIRTFDAPRLRVWKAWTDAQQVARWWGPKDFTTPVCELDVRVGGAIRIHMQGPDGRLYPMTGTYKEITPPEKLTYTSEALDENGKPLFQILSTITFEEQGDRTRLTLHKRVLSSVPAASPYLAGMEPGTVSMIECLAEHLKIS